MIQRLFVVGEGSGCVDDLSGYHSQLFTILFQPFWSWNSISIDLYTNLCRSIRTMINDISLVLQVRDGRLFGAEILPGCRSQGPCSGTSRGEAGFDRRIGRIWSQISPIHQSTIAGLMADSLQCRTDIL